ncbi:MAG TPA: sulfur carrier protein ThiS [Candidatus Corynebacterium gallistercoris]|uniref:Sulfur carrier protein ThiS n=1 Tax=Candidatus Corynebacterium gallistercoris TaxID=2838530 RepID=A0A9D1S165_9CORY|nr:sulfur carrier protein ThiS [Candidatus Corynebacterium gallistercoris]
MIYSVNNEHREAAEAPTVADIVTQETGEDSPRGVAVAVDGSVVPASDWSMVIDDGARVDILIAVQGG